MLLLKLCFILDQFWLQAALAGRLPNELKKKCYVIHIVREMVHLWADVNQILFWIIMLEKQNCPYKVWHNPPSPHSPVEF